MWAKFPIYDLLTNSLEYAVLTECQKYAQIGITMSHILRHVPLHDNIKIYNIVVFHIKLITILLHNAPLYSIKKGPTRPIEERKREGE